jgi:Family of unknown function (DUF6093)
MTSPVDHAPVEQYVRSFARGNMRCTVTISRPSAPVFDPQTGSLAASSAQAFYDGPARVYTVQGPVTYSLGDEPQHYSSTYVSVPIIDDNGNAVPIPRVEDVVTVTADPGNPGMVNRSFQVQDVETGGQWSAVHRMQVVGIQASPQWGTP